MQHKEICLLFCKFTLHVSGVNHTHHQVYIKLTTASGTGHMFVQLPPSNVAKWSCWREVAAQKLWPVPEAVVTVWCTPDY